MTGTVLLANALCLSSTDWQALTQGRMIAAMPWNFTHPGQSFALYNPGESNKFAYFWARCELCKSVDNSASLKTLSKLTVWTESELEANLQQKDFFFLAFLRVYELPQPVEVVVTTKGEFLPLVEPTMISNMLPVLSDAAFSQRKQQLEELRPPLHPELEELQTALAQLAATDLRAKQFEQEIKVFLGWSDVLDTVQSDPDLSWIRTITHVGNSSDGHKFEKLVRKSLIKLGFSNSLNNSKASLDPEATGGAGGLDVYCNSPYSLVGECKASRNQHVPTDVCSQLTYLGQTHLLKDDYDRAIKIIFAAGSLTSAANNVAIGNKMNIIRPETLERLVELKAQYQGSINLLELKPYLEQSPFGEDADTKINQFIDQVKQEIKVRSYVVQLVKKHLATTKTEDAGVKDLHLAHLYSKYPASITSGKLQDILIELSSPLTGFLGRRKESDGGDRFYFLRDMPEVD